LSGNASSRAPTLAIRRGIDRMSLFVAAIGATVTAIFELSVGPYLRVGNAQPHLVLVFAIVCTIAVGLETGLAWGFVGGIVLDVLAQRPLGSSSFALIIVVGLAAVASRMFIRLRPLVVAPAVALLSLVYSMTLFILLTALHASAAPAEPLGLLGPGVAYDAVIAVIVGPLAVAIHDRRADQGVVEW
jgi:rod shape-determining protein MreD